MTVALYHNGVPRCCGTVLSPLGLCCHCRSQYDLAELRRFMEYERRFREEVDASGTLTGYLSSVQK
ncbi:MAG: hypothetical protein Q8R92_05200 [Deltaproteobacteria bacterium]|nr:hypothetical protein [Deltaproteobacteria bacterium]